MNDLAERVADAKDRVAPSWTPERERLVRARIDVRVSMRRRWRRGFAVSAALAAMLAAAWLLWPRGTTRAPVAAAARDVPAALLRLEDGSTVVAKTPDARVDPIEIGPTVASMRLVAGAARFSVTPNPNRAFSVLARDVTVTVLGTVFSVGLEPGGVRVAVERGRVHVAWPAGEQVLGIGEQTFIADAPPESAAVGTAGVGSNQAQTGSAEARDDTETPEAPHDAAEGARAGDGTQPGTAGTVPPPPLPARPPPPTASQSSGGASWRALAQDGDYGAAYSRMQASQPGAVRDEPGDLLLAADVARLGGHPDKAIVPLERVVQKHARDSRAPLAAFTLGRTLLDQLGRPREAAAAFATARRLEPGGAMAQDALAREVESWSRAGEASLARERAEEYVATYPQGRRLGAVRRLGGLD